MSKEISAGGTSSSLWKNSKGLLSKMFNANAEDKRVKKELKKMNTFQLGQAIGKGIQNPETGEWQKLTDDQRNLAQLERLKKTPGLHHFIPK